MRKAAKQNTVFRLRGLRKKLYILTLYWVTLRRLSLVPTCPKNHKNRGFLRFSDVSDSYDQCCGNTASQTSQTVGDFYDVIGRIRSISTSKVHPRQSPTSAIFMISVNMKFACLGYRRCLRSSFLATKA